MVVTSRLYTCTGCHKRFPRKDVLPPVGAVKPLGWRWRCRACHREDVRMGFIASIVDRGRYGP